MIHNNNIERNSLINPSLKSLAQFIRANGLEVNIFEVSQQNNIASIDEELAYFRRDLLGQIEKEWSIYLGSSVVLNRLQPINEKDKKNGVIELMLTDKHIRAWDRFFDSDANLLIVFEDDAIIPEENYERFLSIINKALNYDDKQGLYIDLAGGFPLESLGVNQLFKKDDDGVIHFSKPVTNTACSYILNKRIVEKFKGLILLTPILRFIPADWMLNKLFIELDRLGSEVNCFHTYPPVFKHGSFANIWKSRIDSDDL